MTMQTPRSPSPHTSRPTTPRSPRPSSTERAKKILQDSTIWKVSFEAFVCLIAVGCFAVMSWWSFLNTVSFIIPLVGDGTIAIGGVAFNLSRVFGFVVQYTPNILTMAKTVKPPGVNLSESVGQSEMRRYVMLLNIGIILFNIVDGISNFGYYLYNIKPMLPPANIAPLWYDGMAFISAILTTQLEEFAVFTLAMFLDRVLLVYRKASKDSVLPTSL